MTRRITRREALKYSAATGALATGLTGVPRPAAAADTLKVGIVYVSPIAEIGWTKQHSLGAEAIANAFGERVEITAIDNIWDPQAGERVFRELASTRPRTHLRNQLLAQYADSEGRPPLPRRRVRALLGTQALQEPRHLRGQVLRRGRISPGSRVGT